LTRETIVESPSGWMHFNSLGHKALAHVYCQIDTSVLQAWFRANRFSIRVKQGELV
jgi:hypothetical protein